MKVKYTNGTSFSMLLVVAAVIGIQLTSLGSVSGQSEGTTTIANGQDGQSGESGISMNNGTSIDGADGTDGADGIVTEVIDETIPES